LSDHLTQSQIGDFGRHRVPAAEWLSLVDHLAVCEACRLKVEEAVDGEAAYLALRSGAIDESETRLAPGERAHLTFEQMAGFIDGAIAGEDLQLVEGHLTWCEECETEVDDLRAFKDRVVPERERENQLSPVYVSTESRWHRLVAAVISFRPKSPALAFGTALATLLLAVTGWLVWQKWRAQREMMASHPVVATAGSSQSLSNAKAVSPTAKPESATEMIIARLNDGRGQVTLDREGKLSDVDALPPAYRRMIERALTNQRLERSPLLAGMRRPEITPRGEADARNGEFSVIEPVGTVTLSDRPTFRWSRLDGATGYVVEIYDEKFNLSLTSQQVIDSLWTPAQPLKRGAIYYWQVKPTKDGRTFKSPRPPAPQAKFRVLDETRANELERARRDYGSSHLTLGLLYAKAGLLDEAESEFRALLKANPDSALAQRLLKQVREKP
jgi:hypothetical protein